MIWGCFTGDKLGPIVFINILQNNLLPYLNALAKDGVSEIIFQQDNASCHVSNKTRAWYVGATNEHQFSIMDWAPNSPDMNLIENLWAYLKAALHKRYPDTAALHGPPHVIRAKLRERLLKVWWEIGEGVLNQLVNSMLDRVQALIAAGGWYTEF